MLAPPASVSASDPLLLVVAAALGLVTSVLGFYLHRRCCARAPPTAGEAIELTEDSSDRAADAAAIAHPARTRNYRRLS